MRVLIQAHPSRDCYRRILAELPTAQVIYDPEPEGQRSPWRAYAACLALCTDPATLVIQDDAVPAEGLSGLLPWIAAEHPGQLVLLHVNHQPRAMAHRVTMAAAHGERWATVRPMPWFPTIAVIWPPDLAADCLAWAAARPERQADRQRSDDAVVGQWATRRRLSAQAIAPSVVEHPDDVPSLMMSRQLRKPRTAAIYCGNVRGWGGAG